MSAEFSYGGRTWQLGQKWAGRQSAEEFAQQTQAEGGASRHAFTHQKPPNEGYMVGGAPTVRGQQMHDTVLKHHELDKNAVEAHARAIQTSVPHNSDTYQGSWKQGSSVTLDASNYISGRLIAKQLGRERNQDAIYDLGRGQDIPMAGAHKAGSHRGSPSLNPLRAKTGGAHKAVGAQQAGVHKAGAHRAA